MSVCVMYIIAYIHVYMYGGWRLTSDVFFNYFIYQGRLLIEPGVHI